MPSPMIPNAMPPEELRRRLKDLRTTAPREWEASRRLVAGEEISTTFDRLRDAIVQALPASTWRDELLTALSPQHAGKGPDGPGETLRRLTGLPTTKALRALCIFFGLLGGAQPGLSAGMVVDDSVLAHLAVEPSPFDLLLDSDRPSLLDLGAGDLSFIDELAARYVPPLRAQGRTLIAHGLDRVDPRSSLGGAYQAPPERVRRLQSTPGLSFHYWGDADMFTLAGPTHPRAFLPRYDLVTCWAPANPTFAYEPTRLSQAVIREDLERTRGTFRHVRTDGQPALEVRHRGRALLFPSWKFDIRGPIALLDLMTRRGAVAVLGAVDDTVFWELLGQLVADPRMRPRDVILTDATRRTVFGDLYVTLTALPIGGRLSLAAVAPLREDLPRVLPGSNRTTPTVGFRFVEIRRGATFSDMPASLTARRYRDMTEEVPPWFVVFVAACS